jgi:excinuclease ABC subunit A
VVAAGTPEEVVKVEASHTGRYLAPVLKKTATEALKYAVPGT